MCVRAYAINPLPFDWKTLAHNGTNTHTSRGSDWSLFINNWELVCTDPRLSHNTVCAAEHTSITDEKVRSD